MPGPVLIIEDDPSFAEGAQRVLQGAGLDAQISYNPGLEPIRSIRPQLVVLGAALSGGRSGFSLCSRIRRDPGLQNIFVLIVSGPAQAQTAAGHAASPDHADGYLTKDQPLADLVRDVRKLLKAAPPPKKASPPPPPLPTGSLPLRPTTEASTADELWPQANFDAALRKGDAGEPPPPAGRGLEDRVTYLRAQVNQLESSRRNFSELWEKASERGQELAKKVFHLNTELQARQDALKTAEEKIEEFRRFDEKVRAIAQEKDEEERAMWLQIKELKAREGQLGEALEAAKTKNKAQAEQLASLQAQAAQSSDLGHQLSTTEAVAQEQAQQAEALRTQLDELALRSEADRARLHAELSEAQAQTAQLRAKLAATPEADPSAQASLRQQLEAEHQAAQDSLREQLQAAHQAEQESLRLKLEAAHQAAQDRLREAQQAEAQTQLDALRVELARRPASAAGSPHTASSIQAELDQAKRELAALEEQLNSSHDLLQLRSQELEAVTGERASLDLVNTALTERLDEAEEEKGRVEVRVSELEHELSMVQASLSGDIQSVQQKAGMAELQEEELRTLRAALDRAVEEVDDQESELQRLRDELASLREGAPESTRVLELEAQIERQDQRFDRAEQLLRMARSRIAELEEAAAGADQHAATVAELEEELLSSAGSFAELKASEQQLRDQLEAERAAADRMEALLNQAKQKLGSFQADLRSEREERDRLSQQLSQASEEMHALRESQSSLQDEHAKLSQDLVVERDLRAQIEDAGQEQRSQLEDQVEEVQEQTLELRAKLDTERAAARQRESELNNEIASLQEAVAVKAARIQRFEDDMESLRQDLQRSQAAATAEGAQASLQALQQERDQLSAELRRLQARPQGSLSEAEIELAKLRGARTAEATELQETRRRLGHLEEHVTQWRFTASALRTTLEALHADVYQHLDGKDAKLPDRVSRGLLRSLDELQEVEDLSSRVDLQAEQGSSDFEELLAEIDQLPDSSDALGQSLPVMLVDEEDTHNTQIISMDKLARLKQR